jgi:4-carboxymuconolactone decarboxylase
MSGDATCDTGIKVRREVLANEHVDQPIGNAIKLTAPSQEFITRYAWGGVTARDGVDRRMRSATTLAVLTAPGPEDKFELHFRPAVPNGLTTNGISEVLLHTAVYAGVQAANAALTIVRRVLAQDSDRD